MIGTFDIDRRRVELAIAERQLSAIQLAKAAGLSRDSIRKALKRGRARRLTIGKIAAALGVKPAEIVLP